MKNRILSLILVLSLLFATSFVLASCSGNDEAEVAFVSIDANPSVELTVEDGKVVSAYGANEDAQVLLYSEEGIVGEKVEDAVEKITALAIEYGYISEENTVVGTSVSSADDEYAASLNEKINEKIVASADENGLTITANAGETYSILRRLEALKEQNPDNAEIQALTVGKFKLALSASENGDVELSVAVTMDNEELIEIIQARHSKAEAFATAAFEQARLAADKAYETALGVLGDAVYLQYYVSNITKYPTSIGDALLYQIYTNGERMINFAADGVATINDVRDYSLGEEATEAALDALNLSSDEVEKIQNLDGEVTLGSIEAYADKLIKNSQASAELEAIKAELDAVIDSAEVELAERKAEFIKEYEEEILAIEESAQAAFDGIMLLIPAALKATVESGVDTFEESVEKLAADIQDGAITVSEIRESAELFGTKADELEEKMKAQIGEEGVADIAERRTEIEKTMSAQKKALDDALSKAESEAKAFLENAKNERIAKLQS
ncbi:MAG: hypothetical protein IJ515_00880 [Clostridia bacterium]|nr:hypothetical protein [Clostridia bacterium]